MLVILVEKIFFMLFPIHIEKEVIAKEIDQINESGKYLLGLINDILDVSRIENDKFELYTEWCSMYNVVKPIVSMMSPLMKEKNIYDTI